VIAARALPVEAPGLESAMAADKSGKPRSLPLDQAGSQAGIARIV
jgi:hypothetical protein